MVFTTVTLILHGLDDSISISDYVDDDGKFVNLGVQTAAAIDRKEAVHYVDPENGEIIIPYHAIVGISIAKETQEYTKPDDEYCQPMACPTSPVCPSDDGDNTVGSAIVGTAQAG